jgi:rhodanese-related sulfurtransferase
MTRLQVLGTGAFGLAALAAFVGAPVPARPGQIDVNQLAGMIAREEDHVTAIDLAGWIKDRKAGLRVIDVRPTEAFDDFHIPTAESVPLPSISRAGFKMTDTLVLYSDGGAHAAQGWVLLRSLGYSHVYFLRGGLGEWLDDVMNPVIPANAPPDQKEAFQRTVELSEYFGGHPTTGDRPPATPTSQRVEAMKRRGC